MKILAIDEGIYRGPRPITPSDWNELKDRGVRTILNLEYGWYEAWRNIKYGLLKVLRQNLESFNVDMNDETERCIDHGIIPISMRLSDFNLETKHEVLSCLTVMKNRAYHPIYVHCLHGVDRTGIVCAAYRIEIQNWSVDKAIEEMKQLGFHDDLYSSWIESFEEHYASKRSA